MAIRVECPSCERTIKAPDDRAGTKAKCPNCGNVLKIPSPAVAVATFSPPQPVSPAPLPQAQPRRADPAREQDLLKLHPATFRTRPVKYMLTVLLFVAGLITAFTVRTAQSPPDHPELFFIAPSIFLAILVYWHVSDALTTLIVTNKRSILRHGILSKRTREVRHSDVRLLQVDQSLSQRMMGVGRLSIASSGHGEIEISIDGIFNPQHAKNTVDGYRS